MFRIFFTMVTTILVGLGSGYFLWGSRVARLTESLSALTLELDTMRAKLAAPAQPQDGGGPKAADELRVINESIAAMRQELAEQKPLLEKAGAAAAEPASPSDAAAANAQLLVVRQQLGDCMDARAELENRLRGAAPAPGAAQPGYAPAYQQPAPTYQPRRQPIPADEMPDYEALPGR